MPDSLMVIFSLGGPMLTRRLRPRAIRCRTAFLPLGGEPSVTISPWPGTEEGTRGVVAGGQVRMLAADGSEAASRALSDMAGGANLRSDDLELLRFTATNLWTWVGLPLALSSPEVTRVDRGGGVVDVRVPQGWPATSTNHRLHVNREGRVVRHEEGRLVHNLSHHCDFGTAGRGAGASTPTEEGGGGATPGAGPPRGRQEVAVNIATRRRTTLGDRVTLLWADVVAAAVHPSVAT